MTTPNLKHLGQKTEYVYTDPSVEILEHVPNPFSDRQQNPNQVAGTVHIEANEFTSLCPITGQPDFATIVIDYIPRERLVESKSLKLYLGRFRQFGEFHESCVNRIANDLIKLLDPAYIKVEEDSLPAVAYQFGQWRNFIADRHHRIWQSVAACVICWRDMLARYAFTMPQ